MRLLKADEIECRVGQVKKDGSKYSVLLYKTARTDMAILDELYGPMNWQVSYQTVDGSLYCTISIWDAQKCQWISKQSNGTESNMEAEKGKASDALKRAGFMVGIGRELYTAPQIWLDKDINSYSLEVAEIGYNEKNEINRLVIKSKGNVVFDMGKKTTPKAEQKDEQIEKPEADWKYYWDKLLQICPDKAKLAEACKQNGCPSALKLNGFLFNAIKRVLENETGDSDTQG